MLNVNMYHIKRVKPEQLKMEALSNLRSFVMFQLSYTDL